MQSPVSDRKQDSCPSPCTAIVQLSNDVLRSAPMVQQGKKQHVQHRSKKHGVMVVCNICWRGWRTAQQKVGLRCSYCGSHCDHKSDMTMFHSCLVRYLSPLRIFQAPKRWQWNVEPERVIRASNFPLLDDFATVPYHTEIMKAVSICAVQESCRFINSEILLSSSEISWRFQSLFFHKRLHDRRGFYLL